MAKNNNVKTSNKDTVEPKDLPLIDLEKTPLKVGQQNEHMVSGSDHYDRDTDSTGDTTGPKNKPEETVSMNLFKTEMNRMRSELKGLLVNSVKQLSKNNSPRDSTNRKRRHNVNIHDFS
ncbi:hypothetical protein SNE40_014368 [Patella caerulea]|uniref:Uncharacterized protein n=1 Tax=Patella caerulea TaxID=87958 RepID=A0AAN8JHV1_PATCE